jgi:hypothetical protein
MSACASTIQGLVATCGDTDSSVCATSGGTLAAGTACGDDLQCASAWCKGGGVSESVTNNNVVVSAKCGVCTDVIAIGSACSQDDKCADRGICNVTSSDPGAKGTCLAVVKNDVGGACSSLPTAKELDSCKAGLRCGPDQKCIALANKGDACSVGGDCAYPFACDGKTCVDAKTVGAACDPTMGDGGCARDLVCDSTSKTCTAITRGDAGAVCDDNVKLCAVGSCNIPATSGGGSAATGTCPVVLHDGDACDASKTDKVCPGYDICLNGKCGTFDLTTCK